MTIKIPTKHISEALGESEITIPPQPEITEFTEWGKSSQISFTHEAPVGTYFDVIDSTYLKVLDSDKKVRFLRKSRWFPHIPSLIWEGLAEKINNKIQ